MFVMMINLWKKCFNSQMRAEKQNKVQSVLSLPELKTVNPSNTHWLSHECAKSLPALILTLQELYGTSGMLRHLVFSKFYHLLVE